MAMQVYETALYLKGNEYAYLIRLNKTEEGHNYLCVDKNDQSGNYFVGKVYDLKEEDVHLIVDKIEETDIWNDFTFKFFHRVMMLNQDRDIYKDLRKLGIAGDLAEDAKDYILEDLLNFFN